VESLWTFGMLDDVVALLRNLEWMEYVVMNCVSYDQLVIEFFKLFAYELGRIV